MNLETARMGVKSYVWQAFSPLTIFSPDFFLSNFKSITGSLSVSPNNFKNKIK